MTDDYLFVYGTLRRGSHHMMHEFLAHCAEFVDHATYRGQLFVVKTYPGVVPSENECDQVQGEVYRVRNPAFVLPRLDEYEMCSENFAPPQEYERRRETVRLASGDCVAAWVYIYQYPTDGLKRVASGDFVKQ